MHSHISENGSRSNIYNGVVNINIVKYDNTTIWFYSFIEGEIKPFNPKPLNFVYDLLRYSNLIPNFEYKLKGNEKIKKEIEDYIEYLKSNNYR